MTRTDVMASSRPRNADAASTGRRGLRGMRGLLALPLLVLLVLAVLLPSAALAATESATEKKQLCTYNCAPEKNKEGEKEKTVTPAPKAQEDEDEPVVEQPRAEESSLPFTGFDLTWTVLGGLALVGVGASIVVVQRRQGSRGEG